MFYSCLRESIFIYLRVCTFLFLYPSRLFLLWRLLGCSFFAVCCFGVCSCVSSCVLLVSVCKLTSREFHVNSRGGPRWSRCCYGAVLLSLSRWTWVWVNSRSLWWTGRPGMLRFMGSQRVGYDWATDPSRAEQQRRGRNTCRTGVGEWRGGSRLEVLP